MMLHADEFQRFEARVGARTMWSPTPPLDRFRDGAEKKLPKLRFRRNCVFWRSFGTRLGTAGEREATRARDGEG
jgi:hypothetical protein